MANLVEMQVICNKLFPGELEAFRIDRSRELHFMQHFKLSFSTNVFAEHVREGDSVLKQRYANCLADLKRLIDEKINRYNLAAYIGEIEEPGSTDWRTV